MRNLVLTLFAIGLLAVPSQAQPLYRDLHRNDISTGYSFSLLNSTVQLIDQLKFLVKTDPETGDAVFGIRSGGSVGVLNIAYDRRLNNYLSLGGSFGVNQASIDLIAEGGARAHLASGGIYFAMVTGRFDWFHVKNDFFSMYSKLGLGAMLVHGDLAQGFLLSGSMVLPTLHATFIGMEMGRQIGMFAELGLGIQGVFQLGIRARF